MAFSEALGTLLLHGEHREADLAVGIGVELGPLDRLEFVEPLGGHREEGGGVVIEPSKGFFFVGEFEGFGELEDLVEVVVGEELEEFGKSGGAFGERFDEANPLFDLTRGDFLEWGEDGLKKSELVEEDESGVEMGELGHLLELLPDPLHRDGGEEIACVRSDRSEGLFFDGKAEAGRIADRSHHPESVFKKAGIRIANCADDTPLEVFFATDIVEDLFGDRVVKHPVDGEVAPHGIFFGTRWVDPCGSTPIGVASVFPEGGDLKLVPCFYDDDDPKGDADRDGFGEELFDLSDGGIGGDVDVVAGVLHEQIAHIPARKVGDVARLLQGLHHLFSMLIAHSFIIPSPQENFTH